MAKMARPRIPLSAKRQDMPDFSFRPQERLKSRKQIQRIFREGHSFLQFPLRIVWMQVMEPQGESPIRFAVSVGKRRFRKAVDRNRLRRRVREAFRLHKHELKGRIGPGRQVACMAIYIAPEALPYARIEKAMQKALDRLGKAFEKTHGPPNSPQP